MQTNYYRLRQMGYWVAPALLSAFLPLNSFSQGKIILQGQVKQSDGNPLRNSAVMLIQYNPASKTYSAVDSAYTDTEGKYKFEGSQPYFLLAKPGESFSNELPTYYGNSLFSQNASSVSINFGDAVTADFSTAKKSSSSSGTASLGGTIIISGKTPAAPASKLTVFLVDKDKNPIGVTSANSSGDFKFKNLGYGDYFLWVDFMGVDNTITEAINLNNLNSVKDNLHFQVEDGIMNWVEGNYSSIRDALVNKENIYSLNLNSLQHDVAEKSLLISPDGSKMLSTKIGEFTNLESLSIDINGINSLPADIGKLSKLSTLSASLNKLNALPNEMENLKNLKTLNLGKNSFNVLPDLITKLPSLEVLNFENNLITTLPPTINALKNLKELNLSNCFGILALPIQIGELSNLETLNLSGCIKLKFLPKELNVLKNLKALDITDTKLSTKKFQKAVPGCEVRVTKK